MKFYGITPVSNYINSTRIKSFHAWMFHGLAERGGCEFPFDAHVFANSESRTALGISRTGRNVPEICQPSSHLVVNESYAQVLERLSHIRLSQVVFKRLVDVDYEKGNMSWADMWGTVDPCELLRTLPDVPEFHRHIGKYYEVQSWRWQDIVDNYPSAHEFTLEMGTPPLGEKSVVRLSRDILRDYPILHCGDILLNDDAFRTIANGLDRDFFIVRQYNL